MLLSGCIPKPDPTLAPGVVRKDDGVYTVDGMSFRDPPLLAVQQCQMDGNKKLDIMTSTTKRSTYSGNEYSVLIFRCE